MRVGTKDVRSILTRCGGFLKPVASHSLQPYRGCSFGNAACGAGCYVRANPWVTRGEAWGSFVEARTNAAVVYRAQFARERDWARGARRERGPAAFTIFLSSSTDPFLPHEARFRVTRSLLDAMLEQPPDSLIVQTHTDRVLDEVDRLEALAKRCSLRVHLSIESDRDSLPGLPPPSASVGARFDAACELKRRGLRTVVTVSPLLPIADPDAFFARVAACADAAVIDHFIEGDGTSDGSRTLATALPAAIARVLPDGPAALTLDYRERMIAVARRHLPGRVGVSAAGFAGRFLD